MNSAQDALTNTGGRYNPVTNTWTPTSTVNAPAPRVSHNGVWTGSKMIIWGGSTTHLGGYGDLISGGIYDPATDTWATMSNAGAPGASLGNTAVWGGTEMLTFGGQDANNQYSNVLGQYDLASNTWSTSQLMNSPSPRVGATSVWTGHEMIVWGGYDGFTTLNSGARFDPVPGAWTTMTHVDAPSPRSTLFGMDRHYDDRVGSSHE